MSRTTDPLVRALGPRSEVGVEFRRELQGRGLPTFSWASSVESAYFALVCHCLLQRLGAMGGRDPWIASDRDSDWGSLDDWAATFDLSPLTGAADNYLRDFFDRPLSNGVQELHETLISSAQRRPKGEYFTPDWLADCVVERVWHSTASWVDPTVGMGAFALALARAARGRSLAFPRFVGIDQSSLSLLGASVNVHLARAWCERTWDSTSAVTLLRADLALAGDVAERIGTFQRVVGNPPWILWDRLPESYRGATLSLWRHYGLLAEQGMRAILGGGKKDLAMLLTYLAADRLLETGGRLAFVLTQTVFKATSSPRGFRRFRLPDGTPLGVEQVDDLASLTPFRLATTKTAILVLEKGRETQYPVPYNVWPDRESPQIRFEAAPLPGDGTGPWIHSLPCDDFLERVLGPCDYRAHLGANTGGANGVFWFERIERSPGRWRMRNLASRGRKPVATLEVELEPEFLYPLVLGASLKAWRTEPNAWLLMVQDCALRRGVAVEELERRGPAVLAYLSQFNDRLRDRAAYRRYFTRVRRGVTAETGPFYSMFNIGTYTLASYKTVWNRMGSCMRAAAIGPFEGRPVFPQETHAFIPAESQEEADYLALLLNSEPVARALASFAQVGGKSFATPHSIERLRLARYEPGDSCHREIADVGRSLRVDSGTEDAASLAGLRAKGEQLCLEYWRISHPGSPTSVPERPDSR